ncbi:hypothetical protein MACK_001506 [Theileria orientalis]|uniref:Uncharacterized protein n=1 Tax=Theileria orientalis TaxID=68886 RepID=A0A976QTI4_THEOR|nr:hypothetical protein MACK_001506 [Theileria orientalis]
MNNIHKFLGLSIRGDYLSYSLVFNNRLFNLGSISIKSENSDYFSKLNSVLSLIKSEIAKDHSNSNDSTTAESWSVGIHHDSILSRRNTDSKKLYKLCKIKTIVECSSILNFSTSPLTISDSEMCKAIAKLSDSRILNTDDVINFATGKLSNYLKCNSTVHFNSIATSWATALTLQRRVSRETLVLDDKDTLKIQDRLMSDKIVNELISTLNNTDIANRATNTNNNNNDNSVFNSQDELKNVLKRRIHKLVEDYIDHHY